MCLSNKNILKKKKRIEQVCYTVKYAKIFDLEGEIELFLIVQDEQVIPQNPIKVTGSDAICLIAKRHRQNTTHHVRQVSTQTTFLYCVLKKFGICNKILL